MTDWRPSILDVEREEVNNILEEHTDRIVSQAISKLIGLK